MLGVAADELRDPKVPLGEIWSSAWCREAGDAAAALALLHGELLARRTARMPDRTVLAAAAILAADPGATVGSIAATIVASEAPAAATLPRPFGYGPSAWRVSCACSACSVDRPRPGRSGRSRPATRIRRT